jgi:hypothetical protein
VRDRTTDRGKEAKNSTRQTQNRTMSLNMNSPFRFQAIGSVDTLHLTTPGVERARHEKRGYAKLGNAKKIRFPPEAEHR